MNTNATPYTVERIESISQRTSSLVCFSISRPVHYQFTAGQYARLGLGSDDDIVWRPYSIASVQDGDWLDFQLTMVRGGEFAERFARCKPGDAIRLDCRSYGYMTIDQLEPGGVLWLMATGTGFAPYLSIIADPVTWEWHERVIIVHSVRHAGELLPDAIVAATAHLDETTRQYLSVIPIVTREVAPGTLNARIGALMRDGTLERIAGTELNPATARVMLCGNPDMIKEVRLLLKERGVKSGRGGVPGTLATEGYW